MRSNSHELPWDALLEVKHLAPDHKVNRLLERLSPTGGGRSPMQVAPPFWGPKYHHLDRAYAFNEATVAQKNEILSALSTDLLHDSYFVERLGLDYTSKMMRMAGTVEEKVLYALFAADEANHLRWISAQIPKPPTDEYRNNPLLSIVAEIIHLGDRQSLVFAIQIVLEGYAMVLYQKLAESCEEPSYKAVLVRILKDEASHHGSGIVLHRTRGLTAESVEFLEGAIVRLAETFQLWPCSVLQRVEQALGQFSKEKRKSFFEDLGYQAPTMERMNKLRALLDANAPPELSALLERYDPFSPMTVDQLLLRYQSLGRATI